MFKQYVKGKFTGWLLMASLAAILSGCAGCPGENDAGREGEPRVGPAVEPRAVRPPRELTCLGDFSIALADIKREEHTTSLYFAITKVRDTDAGSQSLKVTLVDPHEREYSGLLSIDLNLGEEDSDFALNALPRGFAYVEVVKIRIPKIAPIQTIRVGEKEIAFERVKFGQPRFLEDFGRLAVAKGQSVPVGRWLSFAVERIDGVDHHMAARVSVENKDFVIHRGRVRVATQHEDGTISWGEQESINVSGLSEASELVPMPLRLPLLWKGEEIPELRMLLLMYTDEATGERVLKAHALIPDELPFVELKWSSEIGGVGRSSPAIAADGTIYVGSGRRLYAINSDGSLKWYFRTRHRIRSSLVIAADGTIYVGSGDPGAGRLYALNPDGNLKWSFETGSEVRFSPAIAADGTIYVVLGFSMLYALNPDGSPEWSFRTERWVSSSPVIAADGTIYVGSGDPWAGRLYAINPDGNLKWSFRTERQVRSPSIAADGTIYMGGGHGIYAINPDGNLKWSFESGDEVHSSPAIALDGTILVELESRRLYAFWEDNGGPADSPWPMFGQNPQRTGRQRER